MANTNNTKNCIVALLAPASLLLILALGLICMTNFNSRKYVEVTR